jgi:hypothetical protein
MGARFIAGTVIGSRGFSNCKVNKDETEFSFTYKSADDESNDYKAYVPTRADYEVSVAVVDKAISLGCNIIVYDSWIFPTASGSHYAQIHHIPIYTVPEFIKKIRKREKLHAE